MERSVLLSFVVGFLFRLSSADKVPVLIWSNDRSLTVPHSLVGHTISTTDFAQQYLSVLTAESRRNVVLFVQDKLSLCDISRSAAVYGTDDEAHDSLKTLKDLMSTMPVAQLSSVDSPTAAIADLKAHFAPGSIHELQSPYDVGALSLDPAGRNLIVVKLPETPMGDSAYQTSLRNVDSIIEAVTTQMEKLSTQFVAIYTAGKSTNKEFYSWKKSDASYSGRQLLDATTTETPSASPLASVNGTFLLYVSNLTLQADGVAYSYQVNGESWSVKGCPENSTDECTVSMTYSGRDTKELIMTMTVKKIPKLNTGFWYLSEFLVSFDKKPAENMKTSFVELTPLSYSYHCYPKTTVKSVNASSISVIFNNYQIQGFSVNSDGTFGHYNDCVGFFTVPIWMGVLSSLVLVAILLFGVIMLMDVKTMDRFDDPKGKTITITATD